jgi:hypothetical protein
VSRIPFEKIDAKLRETKSSLLMGKVENPLRDINGWAKGFLVGPIISGLGAIGLLLYHKRKEEDTNAGNEKRESVGGMPQSSDKKENE